MKLASIKHALTLSLLLIFQISLADKTEYDRILEQHIDPDGPGVAVIITKGDETLYLGARGLANIEQGTPLTPQNIFRIGSVTKQFTGAAIMILHEREQLSVSDDIRKYVKDFPTEGHDITIEQLLTHTSGLANYTQNRETMTKRIQESVTVDEMLELFASEKMHFAPGEAMRYSNTGYVLLGKIIEDVSGQSYADFVQENIFNKLGMKNSHYGGRQIIPNRALGYDRTQNGLENAALIDMDWPHAAGSLLSTVEDLNIWYRSLKDGKLLTPDSYEKMIQPYVLNDGSTSAYGYGLGLFKINKYDAIGHTGGIPGFRAYAVYLPQEDLFIASLNNDGGANPRLVAHTLAAEVLDIALPDFTPITVANDKLQSFAGVYEFEADITRTLTVEDGVLFSQRTGGSKSPVIPIAENRFHFPGTLVYFDIEESDDGTMMMKFYGPLAEQPEEAKRK